jgi:uncharacterized protein
MANPLTLLLHPVFLVCLLTWFISQAIKFAIILGKDGKFDFRQFYGAVSGGMPSSHSAVAAAFTTKVFLLQGASELAVLGIIVYIYIVHESLLFNRQLVVIKQLALRHSKSKAPSIQHILKEPIGHEPWEILAGTALGIAIALIIL